MGRRLPKKGGRQSRAKKFKVQDPYYVGPKPVDTKHNRPPKQDEDIIDRMPSFGGAADALGSGDKEGSSLGSAASKKAERRKRKRAAAAARSKEEWLQGKAEGRLHNSDSSADLPSREQGESEKMYRKRLREFLMERQKKARARVRTETKREKLRARDKAKRVAAAKKKARSQRADSSMVSKPAFGEVVTRPPIMPAEVLKSRTKLKKGVQEIDPDAAPPLSKLGHSLRAGGARAQPRDEMAAYASKVKEAYAAIKKRRYGD